MNGVNRKYCELKHTVCGFLSGQQCVMLTYRHVDIKSWGWILLTDSTFHYRSFLMHSSQLHCPHMPGVHDHAHINEGITSVLMEWCFHLDDVVAFVTDNGSNVKKSVKEDLDKLHSPCAGQTLNLTV